MIQITTGLLDQTLAHIHEGARIDCETAVLWLGRRDLGIEQVVEVHRPDQRVRLDLFHIQPESMRVLMAKLREQRLHILAQVHSHPGKAFHSDADNEWAIVRHRGALSFVIPHFGRECSSATFLDDVAVFQLNDRDLWLAVESYSVVEIQHAIP